MCHSRNAPIGRIEVTHPLGTPRNGRESNLAVSHCREVFERRTPSESNDRKRSGLIIERDVYTQSLEFITMRRVIAPALLALTLAAFSSVDASAGHLFGKIFGHSSCDACCDAAPACGCAVEPACGCEVAGPVCGCEAPACCDSGCGAQPVRGLLHRLFHKHNSCCDSGCEPTCGCAVEPACGCEMVAPACGCEAPSCCDSGCGAKPVRGLLHRLFHKHNSCCDSGCCEPACGAEPSCGCGF